MIWFTADPHYHHDRIIEYCNRPFSKINEMNTKLINNYNSLVDDNDDVFFLGDFSIKGPEHILKIKSIVNKLKGNKVLILGNHDYLKPFQYIDVGFESVHTSLEWNGYTLVHDPAKALYKNKKYICGHVHSLFHTLKNVFNCGVDLNNFEPVPLKIIKRYFNDRPDI